MANRKITRRYGLPFDGYVSSVKRWQTGPSSIGQSSKNMDFSPFDGSFVRRAGMQIYGDTYGAELGITDAKWSMRARQTFSLSSPSMSDGYPVPAVLFTKEELGSSTAGADDGKYGQLWYRHTDNSVGSTAWRTLGSSFGSATYPTSGGSSFGTDHVFKCVPIWYGSGDGGYTRLVDGVTRRYACPGTRRAVDLGGYMYFPSLHGTPTKWNKRGNKTSAVSTEVERIFPWGNMPPLYPPVLTTGAATVSKPKSNWKDGQAFYYSVVFQFEDGSYSMPFIPRPVSTALTNGLGFKIVGTPSGGAFYENIVWSNIPIGPEGTIARILLRSPSQVLTSTQDVLTCDPSALWVCGIIRNNTQKSYTDTLGDDQGLFEDDNIVRTDHTWPRPSRYAFTLEQRVGTGYMADMTASIIIAPLSSSAGVDYAWNCADTGPTGGWGADPFILQNDGTTLRFGYVSGAPGTIAATSNAITLANKTVQQVVDEINATTSASTGARWVAATVPGSDPNSDAVNLCQTTWAVTGCVSTVGSLSVITGGDFSSIPVGAKVGIDAGGKIASGVQVYSKVDANTITLSAPASAANAARQITFYCDTGDESCLSGAAHTASGYGWMRSFSPSFPVVLHLKKSTQRTQYDKTLMQFTIGSPGSLAVGTSTAPGAFVVGNRRSPSFKANALMGVVDLLDRAIVYYDTGTAVFKNIRAGGTGDDFDYRLVKLNTSRGTIAWNSICAGDGFGVDFTQNGIRVTDGAGERIISNAIWNPSTKIGEFDYEVTQGVKAVSKDDDSSHISISVVNSVLHVCYGSAATSYIGGCNRRIKYDYTPGADSSGIAAVVKGDGEPYGWSSPFYQSSSLVFSCGASDGIHIYAVDEDNVSTSTSTGYGIIREVESPSVDTDDSTLVPAYAYMSIDMCDSFKLKSHLRSYVLYANENNSTGATLVYYRKKIADADGQQVLIPTSSTDDFARTPIDAPQLSRSAAEVVWLRFGDDGSGKRVRLFGIEHDVVVLEDSFT